MVFVIWFCKVIMHFENKVRSLQGPILVIGASGFIGANLLRSLLQHRTDVVGTFFSGSPWRLNGIPSINMVFADITNTTNLSSLLDNLKPRTIFDCASFGAYFFESDIERIHNTNYLSFINILEEVANHDVVAYIHAGSSSEYGLNSSAPDEDSPLVPNSHYAISKAAASQVVCYYGKIKRVNVLNLRLYSVYGPYEDSSRLMPILCERTLQGKLPTFADPKTSRDFVYVDDAVDAFVNAALNVSPDIAGNSYNIGTGVSTSLEELASLAKDLFDIGATPQYNLAKNRTWDLTDWQAAPGKADRDLGWTPKTSLSEGLLRTREWWQENLKNTDFKSITKNHNINAGKQSISVIVACYKDEQAIPIMYERLVAVFKKVRVSYEIIFVNDCSPDNSEMVIRKITANDPNVIGITHSRNFGSQSAFKSGMELVSKEACVLMDGDLQDPPEVIEDMIEKWRAGADVVYGCRVKRDMPWAVEFFYKGFYWLFSALSEVPIPRNAGDFSLLDQSVVYWMLQCKERDAFLRGLRAYIGFKQVGIDYTRPERMFGVTTNNFRKNIGWAKKAIFSFSRLPLHALTAFGALSTIGSIAISFLAIFIRVFMPDSVPKGVTFLSLIVFFFGSVTILGLGLLGEYIGKILEETKARPAFIRKRLTINGCTRPISQQICRKNKNPSLFH